MSNLLFLNYNYFAGNSPSKLRSHFILEHKLIQGEKNNNPNLSQYFLNFHKKTLLIFSKPTKHSSKTCPFYKLIRNVFFNFNKFYNFRFQVTKMSGSFRFLFLFPIRSPIQFSLSKIILQIEHFHFTEECCQINHIEMFHFDC